MAKNNSWVLGVVVSALALGQKLSGYENKPLAIVLTVIACIAFLWWIVSAIREWRASKSKTANQEARPLTTKSFHQETHGSNSPVITGDNIQAGRDVTKIGTVGSYFANGEPATKTASRLHLCFDPDDPACIRSTGPKHAEYRVRVHNPEDGGTAHGTHVTIEAVKLLGSIPVPDLVSLINTCLRVIHKQSDCDKVTLGPGKREYFLLLEYPFAGNTMTIYHTNEAHLRTSGWPLQSYEFTLKAHSHVSFSESVRIVLAEMGNGQYTLRQL